MSRLFKQARLEETGMYFSNVAVTFVGLIPLGRACTCGLDLARFSIFSQASSLSFHLAFSLTKVVKRM